MKVNKRLLIGKSVTYIAIIMIMLIPVWVYAMLSIPYADDFSYSSTMRECFIETPYPFIAAFHAMKQDYFRMGGEWFSNFMGYLLTQLEWNGLLGFRLCILVLHIAFECALLFLIVSMYSIFFKNNKSVITAIGLFAVVLYWIVNNYCNTEIYTWYIACAKYLLPISIMCIGVGCYMRFLHNQHRQYWLVAMICGTLVNGSPLNIAVINCELYCMLMIYGIMRKHLVLQSVIASTVTLIGLIVTMIAPGNFVRYGNDDFYIGGTILGCLSAVLHRLAYLSLHTPFLVMAILLFLWMWDQTKPQTTAKEIHRHPLLMLVICFGCVLLVDGPYVMSAKVQTFDYVQYEDRGIFVQDFAIYTFTVLWILYFALFIKTKWPDCSMRKGAKTSCAIGGIVFATFLVILNNPSRLTTVHMWVNIYNGSADRYACYQESMIQQIENSPEDDVVLEYDTSITPRKDLLILGLRLSEDENRWDWWYNRAVARFYGKEKVNIVYK